MSLPISAAPRPLDRTRRNEDLGTFAERFPILFEPAGRRQKAAKIVAVLQEHMSAALRQSTLLEVGSSTGIMTAVLAEACARVVAFDLDVVALRAGAASLRDRPDLLSRVSFLVGDGCRMPVADESVDIAVCNHVYEHVESAPALLDEIHRVLRPGGVCYFGVGTRHVIIEGHYKLPFLSWLPPPVADLYVKLRGRRLRYDVKLLSYRRLRRLVRRFDIYDYTLAIIRQPKRYAAGDVLGHLPALFKLPLMVFRVARPLLPVHVWVLQKRGDNRVGETIVVSADEDKPWKPSS
jgi:SAM-dependent methyltransferase